MCSMAELFLAKAGLSLFERFTSGALCYLVGAGVGAGGFPDAVLGEQVNDDFLAKDVG